MPHGNNCASKYPSVFPVARNPKIMEKKEEEKMTKREEEENNKNNNKKKRRKRSR